MRAAAHRSLICTSKLREQCWSTWQTARFTLGYRRLDDSRIQRPELGGRVRWLSKPFEFVGKLGLFSLQVSLDSLGLPSSSPNSLANSQRREQITNPYCRVRLCPGSRDDSPHENHSRNIWDHGDDTRRPVSGILCRDRPIGCGVSPRGSSRLRNWRGHRKHEGFRAN
jgi:hypothetical protein